MTTALKTRLEALKFLSQDDFSVLDRLLHRRHELAVDGELIVVEDQELNSTRVIVDGWAFRYKSFADGRRQILNILIPGDIVGFYAIMLNRSDYGVEALTPMKMAVFPAVELVDTLSGMPKLALAISWIAGQSERLLDEQITRIGRRGAAERMAHLFLELHLRMRKAGSDRQQACILPLTQTVLADALGMSHVHANRSFRALVREGYVALRKGNVELRDLAGLARCAKFDASYLEQPAVPSRIEKVASDF